MLTIPLYDLGKKKIGNVELPESVFGAEVSSDLIYEMVKAQLASRREGSHKTKEKGEVRGGGKKPWRQKGTGRARSGSIRSPLWVGGGVTFGPRPRSYAYRMPAHMRRKAICSALSQTVKTEGLFIVKDFKLAEIKTKNMKSILDTFGIQKGLVVDRENKNLQLSVRNLENVKFLRPEGINVFDVLKFQRVLVSEGAVQDIISRLSV